MIRDWALRSLTGAGLAKPQAACRALDVGDWLPVATADPAASRTGRHGKKPVPRVGRTINAHAIATVAPGAPNVTQCRLHKSPLEDGRVRSMSWFAAGSRTFLAAALDHQPPHTIHSNTPGIYWALSCLEFNMVAAALRAGF